MMDRTRIGTLLCIALLSMASPGQAQATPKPALLIGRDDFVRLRWIEGSWKGESDSGAKFFERYRFPDDSTLLVESFADAKFSKPTQQARYEWRDRKFASVTAGPKWTATAFDSFSVGFTPVNGAKNSFIWQRVDDDHWTAAMSWPPTLDKPARSVVYHMERVKGK